MHIFESIAKNTPENNIVKMEWSKATRKMQSKNIELAKVANIQLFPRLVTLIQTSIGRRGAIDFGRCVTCKLYYVVMDRGLNVFKYCIN